MNIGGYGVREHIKLLAPAWGLIAAVWLLRWVLDALGAPRMLVVALSVSGATALAILIAVGLFLFRSFGGYSSVLLASFLIVVWAHPGSPDVRYCRGDAVWLSSRLRSALPDTQACAVSRTQRLVS